ncbi:MAG: hypothetical protein FWD89_04320 [Firmicutes bacterium]|nr:hypothetical protein [Bacillota bacterium]
MIAIKNLQHMSEILLQEELLQAVALHYSDMFSDKKAQKMMKEIIKVSESNHNTILTYLKGDVGKKPLSGKVL